MGLLSRKDTPLSNEELQRIKERVENPKIEKNESVPPQKLIRTDFVENSKNIDDNGSTEMKLIKILNEIENTKAKIDEDTRKVLEEVQSVYKDVEHIGDLLREVPKETLSEMKNMKKNLPAVYDGLKQSIGEHIRARVMSAIDSNILKVIKDAVRINSTDLLTKIESAHICSKNTLYVHLTRLEDEGYLVRKREMHEVYYTVPDVVRTELEAQEPAKKEGVPPQPAAPA